MSLKHVRHLVFEENTCLKFLNEFQLKYKISFMFIPYPPVLNYVCLRANFSMPSSRTSVFGSLNIGALCLLLSAGKNNYYNYLESCLD